jgi:hypothetical protein
MKKRETLLEKAKKIGRKPNTKQVIKDEHVELALAWAKNEISFTQVAEVLGKSKGSIYAFLAHAFREYVDY